MSTLCLVGFNTSKVNVTLIEKCFRGRYRDESTDLYSTIYGVGFTNLDIVTDTVLLKGTMSA